MRPTGALEAAPLPVPEVFRREGEAAPGELFPAGLAQRGEGLGGPLPFVGGGGGGDREEGEEGKEEAGGAKARRHVCSTGHRSPREAAAPPPARYFVASAKKAFIVMGV